MIVAWLLIALFGSCFLLLLVSQLLSNRVRSRDTDKSKQISHLSLREIRPEPTSTFDARFQRVATQTHWGLDSNSAILLSIAIGVIIFAGVYLVFENELASAISGAVGVLVCLIVVGLRAIYVRSKVQEQIPNFVEMLAGAVRAGISVDQGLSTVARKTSGFLGIDLSRCVSKIELGLPGPLALRELADQYQLLDLSLLVSALSTHRQTGGDLASVLDQLTRVSRERLAFYKQLNSMTVSARLASVIVGSAAPFLIAYYAFYGYGLAKLWDDPSGRFLLMLALGLEIVGAIWVVLLIRKEL